MSAGLVCPKCGRVVSSEDSFCGSCGVALHSPAEPLAPANVTSEKSEVLCPFCGQGNSASLSVCESCGSSLSAGRQIGETAPASRVSPGRKRNSGLSSLAFLQSWKIIAGFLLIVVLILTGVILWRSPEPAANPPSTPSTGNAMAEVEQLEKALEARPNDAPSLLSLANLLHDVRMFPRAIAIYQRYLSLNPGDADARVDMGTSFFEMAIADSVRRGEYLAAARSAMLGALQSVPRHQLAHFNLGIISLNGGDLKEATDWFKKCIAIDPRSPAGEQAQQLVSQHSFTN